MRRAWIIHMLVVLLILLVGLLPVISVAVASGIADANDCTLHEGFVNPCVINGQDYGETLYFMAMMGWFAIATIPLAAIAALAYIVIVLIVVLVRRTLRRRKARLAAPDGADTTGL